MADAETPHKPSDRRPDGMPYGTPLDAERGRELGKIGQRKSAEVKRRKKRRREVVAEMLDNPISKARLRTLVRIVGEIPDEDATVFATMTAGLVKAAREGNVKAYETLYDLAEMGDGHESMTEDALSRSLREFAKTLGDD